MTNEEILNIKFMSMDLNRKITIKEYFKELLKRLWVEEECFSGKRPFGNSGWQYDLYKPLIENNLVTGIIDENGYVDECDNSTADKIIHNLIKFL